MLKNLLILALILLVLYLYYQQRKSNCRHYHLTQVEQPDEPYAWAQTWTDKIEERFNRLENQISIQKKLIKQLQNENEQLKNQND